MKTITFAFLVTLMASDSFAQSTGSNATEVNRVDSLMFYFGNKHWYEIIRVSPDMSWHAMRDSADKLGGFHITKVHLATIDSEGENNALAQFVSPNLVFLGATDESSEGNWSWITGEPFDFTAWKPGHPNPGLPDADYLILDPSDSLWIDTVSALSGTQILVVEYDSCCRRFTGDMNCDGRVDVADLTEFIDFLFIFFRPLCCSAAANVDGDPGGVFDIADLTFLIDHLFINFPPPASCR